MASSRPSTSSQNGSRSIKSTAHLSYRLVLFGKQLKKLREARNLSQERLGELCDFNRQYIGRIERGERVISFEYMMRIAYNLQVKPTDLYMQIPVPNRMPKKGEYKGQKKSGTKKVPL